LRVLGGVDFRGSFEFLSLRFSCSFYFGFELFLSSSLPSCLVCCFSCLLLALRFSLLLDDIFELFLTFGLLAVPHGILDSNFKLCAFVINGLITGEIEKTSGQYLGLISDESWTCHGLNLNPGHFGGSTTFILVSC
jgi:hypothetical protein